MSRAVSKAQLARAVQALADAGTPALGILCLPDGSSAVLTQVPTLTLPADQAAGDWLDLVGDEETTRASGH